MALFASVSVAAQDQKFKIGVAASASEVKGLVPSNFGSEGTTYSPNIVAEGFASLAKAGQFRFSAGVVYKRNFETYINTYHLGGQISYHYSLFEPFARISAGIDDIPGNKVVGREVTVGADLNFKNFYIRPLAVGFKRTGEFLAPAERTFQSGFGFHF